MVKKHPHFMLEPFDLLEKLKAYDPNVDENLLNKAYVFAMKAHGEQKRASGDPYFHHPLEVAGILTDFKLDHYTIITALLHDTVEDTTATLEDIEKGFGSEIANLVNGVTKLSKLELQSEDTKQAENFRKLLLAMSGDIRVILVKLADRLHNMRTLHFIKKPLKRKRIAKETLEIYAPLAARMGIHGMKDELEDLGFSYLYPDVYSSIQTRLESFHKTSEESVKKIINELSVLANNAGVSCTIAGRVKKPYSIWMKIKNKHTNFEQMADIVAFRLIVESIPECYRVLGLLHGDYTVLPGRFKDYISTPKPNGYQSLHTSIIGPLHQLIEVQIRTQEMHDINELGIAAHWQYKQGENAHDGKKFRWMRELLEILEQANDPSEFLESTKLEMFDDQVFCFTPKGDLIPLPSGSTPIDFAYSIHSNLGDHAISCKINGKQVPLRTLIGNGDVVEIQTSPNQTPSPSWERFVVTGKARSRIRRFIRLKKRDQFSDIGKQLLQKTYLKEELDFVEKDLNTILSIFKASSLLDLYTLIGEGTVSSKDVLRHLFPNRTKKTALEKVVESDKPLPYKAHKTPSSFSLKGLIPGVAIHFAECCHPVRGDHIIGVISTGKGVNIHTRDCENLARIDHDRLIDVDWENPLEEGETHIARLRITFYNKPGSLANTTSSISRQGGNINNIRITNRSDEFWDLYIDVSVKDREHLEVIIASLKSDPIITSVERK